MISAIKKDIFVYLFKKMNDLKYPRFMKFVDFSVILEKRMQSAEEKKINLYNLIQKAIMGKNQKEVQGLSQKISNLWIK